MNIHFSPTPDEINKRLDHVLVKRYVAFSRSLIQRSIREGQMTVNEKTVPPHYFLRGGDAVTGTLSEKEPLTITPNPSIPVTIIHEENDFLILEKPAGLVVHQSETHRTPDTLVNALLAHDPHIISVGEEKERPGIVHRLDADVSGVMVVVKTQRAFEHLKRMFQERRVEKIYTALVYGKMPDVQGTINFSIARSATKKGKMAVRPKNEELNIDEKEAITEYTVLKQYQQYALLEVRPKTGRTHQIRVHLYSLGYPIVGDQLYHPKEKRKELTPRIFLHATRLTFPDLSGTIQSFTSPLPAMLANVLTQLL